MYPLPIMHNELLIQRRVLLLNELADGKERLIANIQEFTPRFICFMGKKCCQ
jgi:hypothetical protein